MNTTEQARRKFADARILTEGALTTPQGDVVHTIYVDLAGKLPPDTRDLAKASEPQFDLRTADTVRLSRPGVFRETGEVLVKDEQEGHVETSTSDTVKGPTGAASQMDRRLRAINAGLHLCHSNLSVSGTKTVEMTESDTSSLTFGKDWLVYCTSLWPEASEEAAWRRTFPESYTSVARVHRPTQFAQALGLGVCEHIGATGKPAPMKGAFDGFKTFEVHRTPQIVLHGPVLYVDDPYRCIDSAEVGWTKICSMIFVKSREYAAQMEYRFAMLSIRPEVGEVFDLPVSGMLRDCLLPVKAPFGVASGPVKVARNEEESGEQRETNRRYTYRRRRVRRESGNWKVGEPGSGREREEIVEETVTSPEEVPEPFPEEAKQPDIIVFERTGRQVRFAHHVYRDVETERMRIETLRTNPAIVDDPDPGDLPQALEIPPEDRLATSDKPPTDPRLVLELCLNASVPRSPGRNGLAQCSRVEVEHVLGCWRSLGAAVAVLDGEDGERAAASAWYAAEFIADLVSRFGPIVKSVCVIRECVAVVEFERAPLSEAVGWATFSGSGTCTFYVHRGNVEEVVFSGRFSRTGRMSLSTFTEALQRYGWPLKAFGSGIRRER